MPGAAKKTDLAGLSREFRQVAEQLKRRDFRKPLLECKVALWADLRKNIDEGHSPDGMPFRPIQFRARNPGGTGKPLYDRGLLIGSVSSGRRGSMVKLEPTSLIVGTNLEYAATHQSGAVIKPRRAKALAIPKTPQAVRAGSPRNFPKPLALVWPKGSRVGFLIEEVRGKSKKDLGEGFTRTSKTIMHYLLVSKVTIPARPFVGISQAAADNVERIFDRWLGKLLGE